jgi:hypothetical protein
MHRHAPAYQNRSPEQILGVNLHFDSAGYLFRAVSWLDYFDRTRHYTSLLYACVEGRMGIECLLFEELVISTGARLSRHDYERCVRERGKFVKLIRQLSPDYDKLQEFARVVIEITPGAPKVIYWALADLEKKWGILSKYIHWSGHPTETTEDDAWLGVMRENVAGALVPIWKKMSMGQSGVLHPDDMAPTARAVWDEFKNGRIDIERAKIRLQITRPATWSLI